MVRPVLVATALLLAAASAPAAPVLSLQGVPESFVPGDTFTLAVALVGAEQLANYNIRLLLETDAGIAGTDAFFDPLATPPSRYVFADYVQYYAGIVGTSPDGLQHRLTVSHWNDPDGDGTLAGVTTVAGVNDLIAQVTVHTTASAGNLQLRIDPDSDWLELETPAGPSIDGYSGLQAALISAGPTVVDAIPEPTCLAILLPIGLWALRRRGPAR